MLLCFAGSRVSHHSDLDVGAGSLFGTTIFMLTVPWACSVYQARVPCDPHHGGPNYRGQRSGRRSWSWSRCDSGCDFGAHTSTVRRSCAWIALSAVPYLALDVSVRESGALFGDDATEAIQPWRPPSTRREMLTTVPPRRRASGTRPEFGSPKTKRRDERGSGKRGTSSRRKPASHPLVWRSQVKTHAQYAALAWCALVAGAYFERAWWRVASDERWLVTDRQRRSALANVEAHRYGSPSFGFVAAIQSLVEAADAEDERRASLDVAEAAADGATKRCFNVTSTRAIMCFKKKRIRPTRP